MDRKKLRIVWICLVIEVLALVLLLTQVLSPVLAGLLIMAVGATIVWANVSGRRKG